MRETDTTEFRTDWTRVWPERFLVNPYISSYILRAPAEAVWEGQNVTFLLNIHMHYIKHSPLCITYDTSREKRIGSNVLFNRLFAVFLLFVRLFGTDSINGDIMGWSM